jgi:hypothetical protein
MTALPEEVSGYRIAVLAQNVEKFVPEPTRNGTDSPPAEQLLDVGMRQLHPGRPAVVALAAMGCDFHLAQQGVHLGHRQDPTGPDRAMAGNGRRDMIELVAQA